MAATYILEIAGLILAIFDFTGISRKLEARLDRFLARLTKFLNEIRDSGGLIVNAVKRGVEKFENLKDDPPIPLFIAAVILSTPTWQAASGSRTAGAAGTAAEFGPRPDSLTV